MMATLSLSSGDICASFSMHRSRCEIAYDDDVFSRSGSM
jgi:hypothetical protein